MNLKEGNYILVNRLLNGEIPNPPIIARIKRIVFDNTLKDYVIYWEIVSGKYKGLYPEKNMRYWGQNFLFNTFKTHCKKIDTLEEAIAFLI